MLLLNSRTVSEISSEIKPSDIPSPAYFGKGQFLSDKIRSLPCLVTIIQSVLLLDFVQIGLVKVVTWISLSC